MTQARTTQVHLDATPFYHCYVRCVRRAFLCGSDAHSGNNYDHRKQWLVSRLRFLSYIYAIDICAYAIMSNHYHVVLHVDAKRAHSWSQEEVVERWLQLYKGNLLINKWLKNKADLSEAELTVIDELIEDWRNRLCCISWFMRGVNETIARMANEEENTKGRFWEGRFKSQALLDDAALLSCMAYVDLNPVRAGMADNLINSDFTSIQQRLMDFTAENPAENTLPKAAEPHLLNTHVKQQVLKADLNLTDLPEAPLMPLDGSSHTDIHTALPFSQADYFALVDTTGRCIRSDKRGAINPTELALVKRLGLNPDQWLKHIALLGKGYGSCMGEKTKIQAFCSKNNKRWGKGAGVANKGYLAA